MPLPRWLLFLLIAAVVATGVLGLGYRNATQPPVVVRYLVDDVRRPSTATPLRIILLSDIHAAGPDMPIERLRHIVAQTNALRPDIVALTGDFVSDKRLGTATIATRDAVAPFAALRSRLGVFAVLGNHDHWRDGPAMTAALRKVGVQVLDNRSVDAGPVVVAGVDDLFTGHADLAQALEGADRRRPVLLLSHSPDLFPNVDSGVAVTLAGHTHAGQIALPVIGALFTASRHGRRYAHGHVVERGRHLVVSSGLGTSILPLRFGAPPEIVVVDLR